MDNENTRTRHYAGIDPAKRNTGVAVISICDDVVIKRTTRIKIPQKVNGISLLIDLRSAVTDFLNRTLYNSLLSASAIEGPSLYSVNRADDLGQVRGVLSLVLSDVSLSLPHIIPPTSLKKFATGNGSAKKENMVEAAIQNGWGELTEDEADAAWLAEFAWALTETRKLTRKQLEAIRGTTKKSSKKTHATNPRGLNI